MTVIVFATKTDVFTCLEQLSEWGIGGNIVPVPKQLKMGCGLAVGINDNYFQGAYSLVRRSRYSSFRGIYRVSVRNGVKILTKLV